MSKLVKRSMIAAAVAASLFGVATPAGAQPVTADSATTQSAPPALQDCPADYVCLWTDVGFSGTRWQGTRVNNPLPEWMNNKSLSSFNNDNTRTACLYRDMIGRGEVMREGPGSRRADLRADPRPSGGNWAREFTAQAWTVNGTCPTS